MKRSSSLLVNESPMVVLPSLAEAVGLNEAIILQQVHYWLRHKQKAGANEYFKHNRWWVYNSLSDWSDQFPFWSKSTVNRVLTSLRDQKLLVAKQLSEDNRDRTLWYTINYKRLNSLSKSQNASCQSDSNASCQSDNNTSCQSDKMYNKETETTTETSETESDTRTRDERPIPDELDTTDEYELLKLIYPELASTQTQMRIKSEVDDAETWAKVLKMWVLNDYLPRLGNILDAYHRRVERQTEQQQTEADKWDKHFSKYDGSFREGSNVEIY